MDRKGLCPDLEPGLRGKVLSSLAARGAGCLSFPPEDHCSARHRSLHFVLALGACALLWGPFPRIPLRSTARPQLPKPIPTLLDEDPSVVGTGVGCRHLYPVRHGQGANSPVLSRSDIAGCSVSSAAKSDQTSPGAPPDGVTGQAKLCHVSGACSGNQRCDCCCGESAR